MRARAIAAALLAWLAAAPAAAHEYWLAPSAYRAQRGDTIAIHAFAGTGFRGEPKTYVPWRVTTFCARAATTSDLRPLGVAGDLEFARFVARDDGGALVGYATDFARIELPAPEFDRYLETEGLDQPLAARARLGADAPPGRERYARCAKTWIAGRTPSRCTAPLGLPLEIVPLGDPLAGRQLEVRVLFEGRPLEGARVRAWRAALPGGATPTDAAARDSVGACADTRTDRRGVAAFDVSAPGEWLIATVHMTASAEPEVADWESRWASFTFARGAARP